MTNVWSVDPIAILIAIFGGLLFVGLIVVWEVAKCLEQDLRDGEFSGSNPMDRTRK